MTALIQRSGPGRVQVDDRALVNLASCDYLGLSGDPRVLAAAHQALDRWGLGSAAGRTLSGNTTLHRELEHRLAAWVGCEDAVLHGSCWSANAAVFGTLAALDAQTGSATAVFSDRLNHASIIDAIRTQRRNPSGLILYDHDDVDGLRRGLAEAADEHAKVIVTDGVFSMEGDQAPLAELCALAEEFGALLVVDDSHGTGVVGATGRGSAEAQGVLGRVDVLTGTLGKALGGAIGGFVAGSASFTAALRKHSRPYLFSNNPPPAVVAGALAALDVLENDAEPLAVLRARVRQLRDGVARLRVTTYEGDHPIVPIILGEEDRAAAVSTALLDEGFFTTPLRFPVVPRGTARLRLQVSAAHSATAIDQLLGALARHAQD
ncbi:aminotransferase class I/II-fold pyridoxal phosphate-dependent enzyme [Amycolatopsis magusensis]|uniref:aminotransferase class I/II-fold pyridoxal phosphate-dependent enzyme n=1 Tax=Amycolatopsis magusensis TaxID=882444 RepID=UPI003C2FEDA4